tara:strand:- start:422 stop:757 length:336 start_codon:yes stop_codon:yes gene_type:complete
MSNDRILHFDEIPIYSHYVVCHDTFMSGWGMAHGRKNILIFACDWIDEAVNVAQYAESRDDMASVNVYQSLLPTMFNREYGHFSTLYVQIKTKETMPNWYGYAKGANDETE